MSITLPSRALRRATLPTALLCCARLLPAQAADSSSRATAPAAAPATAAAAAPTAIPVALFGEVRTRSEWDRAGTALPNDLFTYLRARLGVRAEPVPGARLVLQVQDSRVLGAESSGSAAARSADVLDLHQGYLELAGPWRSLGVSLRAGRQEIALGNERLVGAGNWTNLGRSFDGVRIGVAPRGVKAGAERWTATAFAAVIDERGRHFGPATSTGTVTRDHALAGAYLTRTLSGVAVDATLLYDAGASYRAYSGADRATFDARLRVPRAFGAPVRVELEGAWQAGRQRWVAGADSVSGGHAQTVGAWLAGARVGTPTTPGRAVATLGLDVLSGDTRPDDGRYSAFNTLYATNHPFYGLMDVVGDPAATTKERGLSDAFATVVAPLAPSVALRAELHRFALATGAARPLGMEADAVLPIRVNGAATVDLGYALFRAERGASAVGLGADGAMRHWAFLQLDVAF